MPLGARPAWLVGHKARIGRFGQRECDRRFGGGAAGAHACGRRAAPACFRAVGVVFLPSEDVQLVLGALFEIGGDNASLRCDRPAETLVA
jgi:hypothetical protein